MKQIYFQAYQLTSIVKLSAKVGRVLTMGTKIPTVKISYKCLTYLYFGYE